MSVRVIILLLALPLFLLLAAVNSLLLYAEDTAEMKAGLRAQALAAAVTVAEFAKSSPDPFAALAEPRRLAALHQATKDVPGLTALYLVRPGADPLNLLGRPLTTPRRSAAPATPRIVDDWRTAQGAQRITALAPIGKGAMVVADIDAEPLARRAFHLKRLSIALVAGSAILAILLGLIIARRVIGEFRRTKAIIEAHGERRPDSSLAIREVRDLADAVHLIDASVASELERIGDQTRGNAAIGIAAVRAKHFPDVADERDGLALSIRILPNAPAGCFHVHQPHGDGFQILLGEIAGEPAAALATALALKAHMLAGDPADFARRADIALRAFGCTTSTQVFFTSGSPQCVALHGSGAAMQGYAARTPGLSPDDLTRDLAILFPTAGILAAADQRAGATIKT